MPNTVFPCGVVHDEGSGEVRLYYGAADTTICLATARLDELLEAIKRIATEKVTDVPSTTDADMAEIGERTEITLGAYHERLGTLLDAQGRVVLDRE